MGNFGKRLLIITLSALAIVALAIVGNSIQQSKRTHTVSNSNELVYGSNVTKGDLWDAIINSSITDTVNENLNRALLADVIAKVTDDEAKAELQDLEYGEHYSEFFNEDGTAKTNLSAEEQKDKEDHEEGFKNTMYALGYFNEAQQLEYAKLQVAYRKYATYRIENKLTVGNYDYKNLDLEENKETWTTTLKTDNAYIDAYALAVFFNSTDEADDFIKDYVENSEYQIVYSSSNGIQKFAPKNYSTNAPAIDNKPTGWTLSSSTNSTYEAFTLTYENDNVTKVYALNYVEGKGFETGKWYQTLVETKKVTQEVPEGETDTVSYTEVTFAFISEDNVVKDKTSNLSSNETYTSKLATNGENYKTADKTIEFAHDETGLAINSLTLKSFTKSEQYSTSYRNVGDNDFYLTIISEIYNKYYNTLIEELGLMSKFEAITPSSFVKASLISKGYSILEGNVVKYTGEDTLTEETALTSENTKVLSQAEMTSLYFEIYGVDQVANENAAKYVKNFLYDQATYTTTSTFGSNLYSTLSTDEGEVSATYKVSSDPYYLVYKLTDTTNEVTDEALTNYREELIEDLLDNSYFITMCLAELRKEAKVTFYDKFLSYAYNSELEYSSSYNTYGISDDEELGKYLKKGLYSNKTIAKVKTVSFTFDENNNIESQNVNSAKYKLTTDMLYDYCMNLHAASYISSVVLQKDLLAMEENTIIHGKDDNFLTSDNWRMTQYRESAEYYNYLYEYYTAYGYYSYDNLKEFLYTNFGVRSWDDLVNSYKIQTVRNFFIYYNLVNSDFTKTDVSNNSYFKSMVAKEESSNVGFDFQAKVDKQFSFYASHLLVYIDINNDGTMDDFEEFKTTGEYTKPVTVGETQVNYQSLIDELYSIVLDYVASKGTYSSAYVTSSSSSTPFNSFITEYENASILDSDYAKFKQFGIKLTYENLGEITETTNENYAEGFQQGVLRLKDVIKTDAYNKATDYYIDKVYTTSSFGEHIIIASLNDDYEKVTFETEDAMNQAIAKYIQKSIYETVFGTTDDPKEKSDQVFEGMEVPTMDSDVIEDIEALFSDEIATLIDSSNSYHSQLITLNKLYNNDSNVLGQSTYKDYFGYLIETYEYTMFSE